MVEDRLSFVTINGLSHALHEFVAPEVDARGERVVLLVHGFLDAGGSWDLVAGPLARAGYRVVAPDLRGFGATERVGAGGYYHFPDYTADLDELTDRLAAPWLAVIGHSMGGGVVTMFAGARPEKVTKLVVLEGLGPMNDPPDLAVDRCKKWLNDRKRLDRTPRSLDRESALTRLRATHPRLPEDLLRGRLDKLLVRHESGDLTWAWDPLHRSTAPTQFHAAAYCSFLRAIECPVLFIDGGPLGWHPPDEAERLACIRNLETASFPDAGHMMHWTAPEPVAQAILDFLAR
jgi:pimeloyl-ACP methyl ester carboxylesterase